MKITKRLSFDADCSTVYQMMCDRSFLERLVERADATSSSVDIAGPTTRITMDLPVPPAMSRFAGATMKVVQTTAWQEPLADGSRLAELSVETPGLPSQCSGTAQLRSEETGSVVDIEADFKVTIPFVGGQVEQKAAPYISQVFEAQQDLGAEWLAERR